jgi:hypothetical protein
MSPTFFMTDELWMEVRCDLATLLNESMVFTNDGLHMEPFLIFPSGISIMQIISMDPISKNKGTEELAEKRCKLI